jgi:hypothetical protein
MKYLSILFIGLITVQASYAGPPTTYNCKVIDRQTLDTHKAMPLDDQYSSIDVTLDLITQHCVSYTLNKEFTFQSYDIIGKAGDDGELFLSGYTSFNLTFIRGEETKNWYTSISLLFTNRIGLDEEFQADSILFTQETWSGSQRMYSDFILSLN